MNRQLMEKAEPVIDLLVGFRIRIKSGEEIDPGYLRRKILESLDVMVSGMSSIPELHNKIETVKHVLVYFADEVILDSGWSHVDGWFEDLLELELFNSRLGGEQFYEKLEKVGMADAEMAELFYTCLSLGFRGKFGNDEAPLRIRENLYSRFRFRLPDDERRMTPGAERVDPGISSPVSRMFGLWTLGIVFIVTLGLYLITSQLIWKEIAGVVRDICSGLWI